MKKRMKKQGLKFLLFALTFFVLPEFASANPDVSAVAINGQSWVISGNGFGIRSMEVPKYWNNFDLEPMGSTLNSNGMFTDGEYGIISSDVARRSKSLLYDFGTIDSSISHEKFMHNIYDFGSGQDQIYFTTWIYYDDTGTTSQDSWDTKMIVFSSQGGPLQGEQSQGRYYWSDLINETSLGFTYWRFPSANRWGNVFYTMYDGNGNVNINNPSLPSDALLLKQWQRIEGYIKNSDPGSNNGVVVWRRIGHADFINSTSEQTRANSNTKKWRFANFGMSFQGIYDGIGMMKMYYADLYFDTTQSRVEICDADTWALRTHCEIQPTIAWPTAQNPSSNIMINLNQGSFNDGDTGYIYVIDDGGNASTANASSTIMFGIGVGDVTAPGAPSGLNVL